MKARLTIIFLGTLVFVIPFGAFGLYMFYEQRFERLPIYGSISKMDGEKQYHVIPDFQLTNQETQTTTSKSWNGKIVIVDFFFSHCPIVCPKMTKSLKRVQNEFVSGEIAIYSISIDPERDNPAQLKRYTQRFSINTSNWSLLTGEKKEIYKLARNGFMIVATDGDGGPDDFIHSDKLVLIDKHRRIRGYYDGTNEREVTKLIHDIKKLNNEN